MIVPPIKDLRGAEMIPIEHGKEPVYPCWCYHSGFGFCYYEKNPGYTLAGTNLVAWLRLNPELDQTFRQPTIMELASY